MSQQVEESVSAGGVVLNSKGEIIVVYQKKSSSWSFPKGHVEEGEDSLVTAKREIAEESGITDLELVKELPSYQRYKIDPVNGEDKNIRKTIKLFLFKTSQSDLKPTDPANPEALWVDKTKVVELLTHPRDKEFFLSVVSEI